MKTFDAFIVTGYGTDKCNRVRFDPKEYRPRQTKDEFFVDGRWTKVPTKIYITSIAIKRDCPPQHEEPSWFKRWRLVVDYTESR
jgi:hypothetical protein